jgi:hypothetical protein
MLESFTMKLTGKNCWSQEVRMRCSLETICLRFGRLSMWMVLLVLLSADRVNLSASAITFNNPFKGSRHVLQTTQGYLANSPTRPLRMASVDEQAGNPVEAVDLPSFQAFLAKMEADRDRQAAAANDDLGQMANVTMSTMASASASPADAETAESDDGQGERVVTSDYLIGAQPSFPRPRRDTQNFEDIFLYFPIESGEMLKLGLSQGLRNSSQFTPPQPTNLKSRAVFERVQR